MLTQLGMKRKAAKRMRVAYPCRVCKQDCLQGQDSVQCDGCESWMHTHCIQMTKNQLDTFTVNQHFNFFCLQCSMDATGSFNCRASLARIASHVPPAPPVDATSHDPDVDANHLPDIQAIREQAESERNLLSFYNVVLPPIDWYTTDHIDVDQTSVEMLRKHCSWLLARFTPVTTTGDGNCMYRAISYALFGTQSHHVHLRLLCCIELLANRSFYDSTCSQFYEPYKADPELVLQDYETYVVETVKDGADADMLTILCISSVVHKPIQTHWPITVRPGKSSPFTKLVTGRDVSTLQPIHILWTVSHFDPRRKEVVINHFVPLIDGPVNPASPIISPVEEHDTAPEVVVVQDEDNNDEKPCADGEPLPLKFLTTKECVEFVSGNTACPARDEVPAGRYFCFVLVTFCITVDIVVACIFFFDFLDFMK